MSLGTSSSTRLGASGAQLALCVHHRVRPTGRTDGGDWRQQRGRASRQHSTCGHERACRRCALCVLEHREPPVALSHGSARDARRHLHRFHSCPRLAADTPAGFQCACAASCVRRSSIALMLMHLRHLCSHLAPMRLHATQQGSTSSSMEGASARHPTASRQGPLSVAACKRQTGNQVRNALEPLNSKP